MVLVCQIEHSYIATTKYSQIDVTQSSWLTSEDVCQEESLVFYYSEKMKRAYVTAWISLEDAKRARIMSCMTLTPLYSVLPVGPITYSCYPSTSNTLQQYPHRKNIVTNLNAWTPSSHSQHPAL